MLFHRLGICSRVRPSRRNETMAKIAVVTGAGSGIGRASSLALLKNG